MIDLFKGELLRFRLWALVAGLINLAALAFLSRMVDLAQQPLQVYQVFGAVYVVAGALLGLTRWAAIASRTSGSTCCTGRCTGCASPPR